MLYMKNIKVLFISFFLIVSPLLVKHVSSQLELPEDKVSWDFSIQQDGNNATILAKVTMEENWHINAVYLPKDVFGIPTQLKLLPQPNNFKLIGNVSEPEPIFHYDSLADENQFYHSNTIKLKQKIKIISKNNFKIKGEFSFQTCDDTHCLPPFSTDFELNVKGSISEKKEDIFNEKSIIISDSIKEDFSYENDTISNKVDSSDSKKQLVEIKKVQPTENMSLWAIFALSFASGLAALLTPCVFPMIPMTVSFFTKQSKTKAKGISNAILYAISIIIIYILLGTVITAIFGAEVLNEMSTNPWFNILFFVLLIVFAVSFMGAFEIRMPNSWINKADSNADRGGIIGIFFMALVLALVSFSCTGPIVGTLLVKAAESGGITPIIGMFGFSLALALPFALFAAFPGWLNSLPQSGGWLNTVKVVLGFLELALAFKFLSNADLAWQTHMLEREVFLAIWIAIFSVLALYLFGKILLPHDSPIEKLSVGRSIFGIFVFAFVVYMIPGLWGAPLKLINAFPPPSTYAESPRGIGQNIDKDIHGNVPEGTHLATSKNLNVFHDYDLALSYAKKVDKPLLLDFTGWNCVNCRKMEESVWVDNDVYEILKQELVIVSLYVDERTELPVNEQKKNIKIGEKRTRNMVTVGDKWMIKQINEYGIAAQPFYIMQTPDGKDLSNGSADFQNHSNPKVFKEWLDKGLSEFNGL